MKVISIVGLVVLVIFLNAGCATIIGGGNQDISINTNPAGAQVRVLDNHNMEMWSSKTPATVNLAKGAGYFCGARYTVEIEKAGYQKRTISIKSSLNGGWYIAGNFIFGGWLGWLIVDPLTGAMWTLEPDMINLDLESDADVSVDEQEIFIVLKEDLPAYVFDSDRIVRIE